MVMGLIHLSKFHVTGSDYVMQLANVENVGGVISESLGMLLLVLDQLGEHLDTHFYMGSGPSEANVGVSLHLFVGNHHHAFLERE